MTDGSIEDLLQRIEEQQSEMDWDTVIKDLRANPRFTNVRISRDKTTENP